MTTDCQADNPDATEVAIDNFVVFFIAGQETTANMLSFVLLEMGRNPDVMLRLESSTLPTTPRPPHPLVPHICFGELGQHWFRYWPGGEQAQCQYLKQWWFIINQTLGYKLQWNSNKSWNIFIHGNAFEYIVLGMAAMLLMIWLFHSTFPLRHHQGTPIMKETCSSFLYVYYTRVYCTVGIMVVFGPGSIPVYTDVLSYSETCL